MGQGIDNIPSDEVSSSHKVCDYLEVEGGFIWQGNSTFYLADYCGLGHLCDEIYMSDLDLAEECNKHCFFVEFDDGAALRKVVGFFGPLPDLANQDA